MPSVRTKHMHMHRFPSPDQTCSESCHPYACVLCMSLIA
jgi:hypothetical protein